ncbi:MAG: hypothetical protein H0W13_02360 [Nitrospirales bacterium]|nr:hypothetical protein [Nitrospirales bacterium]
MGHAPRAKRLSWQARGGGCDNAWGGRVTREGARLGVPGVGGCKEGFGLSRLATTFMNNPG